MRFAYTKAGEPLEDLAARAYAIEGKESTATLRAAGKALRDANPFLRKLSEVPAGTLVVVPPIDEAKPAAATEQPAEAAVALIVARLKEAAAQAIELLDGELHQETTDTRKSLEILASPQTRKLARADEELNVLHGLTEEAAKSRLAAAAQLGDYRKQVASQVEKDLEELLAALHMSGA